MIAVILAMGISKNDSVSLAQVRARFLELLQEVKAGAEKIITKDGEPYVALIDAERLDHYHRLARERIHLLLIDEAQGARRCRRRSRKACSRCNPVDQAPPQPIARSSPGSPRPFRCGMGFSVGRGIGRQFSRPKTQ